MDPAAMYRTLDGRVRNPLNSGVAVAIAAAASAEAAGHPPAIADIRDCTISGCGMLGASFDNGARALLHGCTVARCRRAAVNVKGRCDVTLTACLIEYLDGDDGVHVGVNYEGVVTVTACALVGRDQARAVFAESATPLTEIDAAARAMGLWSLPPHLDGVTYTTSTTRRRLRTWYGSLGRTSRAPAH